MFNAPYNYYQERVALADFLIRNRKYDKAKIVLNDFLEEAENLSKLQRETTSKQLLRQENYSNHFLMFLHKHPFEPFVYKGWGKVNSRYITTTFLYG